MNPAKKEFIQDYIKKLNDELMSYRASEPEDMDYAESSLFDVILEVRNIFSKEMPQIEEAILIRNGTGERDANSVLGILKLYLVSNEDAVTATKEPEKNDSANKTSQPNQVENSYLVHGLTKFLNSFKIWFEDELPYTDIMKQQYIEYDNWNGGTYYLQIGYGYIAQLHYGVNADDYVLIFDMHNPTMNDFKSFIEMIYAVCVEKRYEFTIETNNRLKKFNLPYKLQSGTLVKEGYKSSDRIEKVLNYDMCERKIQFSEEMISSQKLLDKKAALDYIVDSLQYLISIAEGVGAKEKYKNIATGVAHTESSKVVNVVKDELEEIMKIANEFFDIRHNEYLNKAKETREPLNDNSFIEYLYNRIYALTYYLRLKYNFKGGVPNE